jgi:hypothetical protein
MYLCYFEQQGEQQSNSAETSKQLPTEKHYLLFPAI